MLRTIVLSLFAIFAVGLTAVSTVQPFNEAASAEAGGVLPADWPTTLQIGLMDGPGGAAAMKATAAYGFRYQYLSAGVNTGSGWANWNAGGAFATYYIQDSVANGITPVFTYYQIRQSAPGNAQGEADGVFNNLQDASTMSAYYNDLKLFFQKAGAFPNIPVVLHVEPDMWGYLQQRASGDNASTVPVKVAGSGMADVAGFPDTSAGMAQAIVQLRNQYAPNVVLGYHVSIWGTGVDIQISKTNDAATDALATRAGNFYNSLGANFDITFAEFSDRDAGFKQAIYGDNGQSWFTATDFARHARFLKTFSNTAGERVVLWQIPLGNTKMRAQDNTWSHYQDNRVEWLLDDPGRSHLQTYIDSGVVAFLFGGGAGGTTCACDAAGDGVTNPPAINGNSLASLNADDDGGFFLQKVAAYYAGGAMVLGAGNPLPTPTDTTAAATSTPTRTATPAATPTQPATPTAIATATVAPASWTTSATVSSASVARGSKVTLTAKVKSSTSTTALVDLEVYDANGNKVYQVWWDSQPFNANITRSFSNRWTVPANLPTGRYTVKIGVFAPGWNGMFAWNNSAIGITVR